MRKSAPGARLLSKLRAVSLGLTCLAPASPAAAAPAHCEAELAPGQYLISATFDDAGLDKAALTAAWVRFAVARKAGAASAVCTTGSAEDILDNVYGSIFVRTDWTPARIP